MRLTTLMILICLNSLSSSSVYAQLFKPKTVFSHADTLRGSLNAFRRCYDLHYYHLDVKFDPKKKSVSGSNQFQFSATEDFAELQFDLFANLAISKIVYHQLRLPFRREGNAVFVTFPKVIRKNQHESFTVFYAGFPFISKKGPIDGGIAFEKDALGRPFISTVCEGVGASIWWPNKDHLSDEVDSMLISISVPGKLMAVSNGRLRKVHRPVAGYVKYDWFVGSPINNYDVAANIGGYVHLTDRYQGEKGRLTLDYWVLPYNKDKARKQFAANVRPMLDAYEHWFGPYPFYKDGYKLVETPYPAMEHQSAISYGGFYFKGTNTMTGVPDDRKWDFTIIHESAHEWFGNSITAKDMGDLWIHEAFATYAESLFLESQYGEKTGLDYLIRMRQGISNTRPLVGPYGVNKEGSGDMYGKGANLLHMLRTILHDDEKWRQILRGLNTTYYHRTVTYDDIVSYISKASGVNLKPVFDQYLQYSSLPELEFSKVGNGLNYRWKSAVSGFAMPILVNQKGGRSWWIHPTTSHQSAGPAMLPEETLQADTADFYLRMQTKK